MLKKAATIPIRLCLYSFVVLCLIEIFLRHALEHEQMREDYPLQILIVTAGFAILQKTLLTIDVPEFLAAAFLSRAGLERLVILTTIIYYIAGYENASGIFVNLIALYLIRVTRVLIDYTRRAESIGATKLMEQAKRKPILYLRSFRDDNRFYFGLAEEDRSRFGLLSLLFGNATFEKGLADSFSCQGPVVALGRPGEQLAPVGVAREYVGNEPWQPRVTALIKKSNFVIVVVGTTESLMWEIAELIRLSAWRKTVLVFPPVTHLNLQKRWVEFRKIATKAGLIGLPKELDEAVVFGIFSNQWDMLQITHPRMQRGSSMFRPSASLYNESIIELYKKQNRFYDYIPCL